MSSSGHVVTVEHLPLSDRAVFNEFLRRVFTRRHPSVDKSSGQFDEKMKVAKASKMYLQFGLKHLNVALVNLVSTQNIKIAFCYYIFVSFVTNMNTKTELKKVDGNIV